MIKSTRYEFVAIYEVNESWFIEIAIDHAKETYEIFIFNASYGIKDLMFGLPVESIPTEECLLEIIEANVEQYMDIYEEEYMD